jgi:hypothetical protein
MAEEQKRRAVTRGYNEAEGYDLGRPRTLPAVAYDGLDPVSESKSTIADAANLAEPPPKQAYQSFQVLIHGARPLRSGLRSSTRSH